MVTEMASESLPNPEPVSVRTEPLGPVGKKKKRRRKKKQSDYLEMNFNFNALVSVR